MLNDTYWLRLLLLSAVLQYLLLFITVSNEIDGKKKMCMMEGFDYIQNSYTIAVSL